MHRFTTRGVVAALALGAAVVAASMWLPAKGTFPALAGRRPNIILILTDDQGYGDLACHGNPVVKTPNIDRLHDESVRFVDFHVSPTCAPTRASLMTGRHEFKSGVTHTILERERMGLRATTIAQVLKSAGYTTGIFGKWHLGDDPARWPDKRGFDEMFIHGCGGIGQTYPGTCGDAPGNSYFDPVILHNGTFEKTRGYCTDVFFAQAMRWIESQKGKRPFFAYIATNAPHAPLVCPESYEKMYAGKVPPEVAKFFGMITNIDDNVGRLLAELKAWGVERDTLIIFMNDNGGTAGVRVWNAGMRGHKGTPYNGGTRAIGLFRWPGTLKPADVGKLAAHIDIFPTLAELAGAKIPGGVTPDGRSLVPLLADPNAAWPDRYLFTHVGRWPRGKAKESKYAHCSVRGSRYEMVSDSKDGSKRWELYDLKADPGETNDIAARHPEIVKQMEAAYDKWWENVLPRLENEDAAGPAVNPFRELYWKQYGGLGPNNVPPGAEGDGKGRRSSTEAEAQREARTRWFREAKFGMFIHWGLYAIPAGEWKGKPVPGIGEWIMNRAKIPVKEYEQLAKQFNPIKFNADEWVRLAQEADMRYMVITSKHHDGFALFHSKVSPYNVVDATPFKRDVLKELAEACRKHGMRLGFYYSQAQDWHEPNGAGNTWDFGPDEQKDFDQYLRAKAEPQVRELLTNYGPVALIWFDTPRMMTDERAARFVELVRKLQPQCLINGRLRADRVGYDYASMRDNQIPNEVVPGAWETPATMNDTWGYKKDDHNWKPPSELIFKLVDIVSKGGNYLLNVGPTAEGVIPQPSRDNLRAVGRWLKVNGEAIYGAGPTPFGAEFGSYSQTERDKQGQPPFNARREWRCTTKPGKLFIHLFRWPAGRFELAGVKGKVVRAYLLADPKRKPLTISQDGEKLVVSLPEKAPGELASVLCLEYEGNIR